MSDPHSPVHAAPEYPADAVESAVHYAPMLLPAFGAVMIFLLAMIAVVMA